MEVTYRISEQDYVSVTKLSAKLTPRIVLVYSGTAFVLVLLVIYGSQILWGGALWAAALGGLIAGLVGGLVTRYIVVPILARRQYRKYKAIHQEFALELVDDGIRFSSANGDGKVLWSQVDKWRQNDEFILIYLMPRLFYIVPKSVVSQGFDLQALIEKLLHHVGPPK